MSAATIGVADKSERHSAAKRSPLLLLTQTGHFGAVAFLTTMAANGAEAERERRNRRQTQPAQKSTANTWQKSTANSAKNRLPNQSASRAVIVRVMGVLGRSELLGRLSSARWTAWTSNVRMNGLLLLIADAIDRTVAGKFSFWTDHARALCSSLPKVLDDVPREGLAVLERLGIFKRIRTGCRFPRAWASEYRLGKAFGSRPRIEIELPLTPARAEKWRNRADRSRERSERNKPEIGAVREAARRVEMSAQGVEEILRLSSADRDLFGPAYRCYQWLSDPERPTKSDQMRTVWTPISGCPRVIRPYLLIDTEDVVEVDISGAHIAVLAKIYEPAFLTRYGIEHTAEEAEQEKRSLITHIESGDVYGGGEKDERKKRKKELLTSLNMDPKVQMAMEATESLAAGRPIFTAAMWATKGRDHRVLSWLLQRWVSDIVNPAVLALRDRDIPSIPITDCLMVRKRDEAQARIELSWRIYDSTGVCATVGGIRYAPDEAGYCGYDFGYYSALGNSPRINTASTPANTDKCLIREEREKSN